ncbi:MAG: 1-acyl-sn-glycerol-3-phosphate acyltransferase [Acidimicrobiia bacterium]|nr:1-acyl-sn-glycerol-3-phosphate acyltransferase [Acidimicrobiia bacterium]NNC74354.1 1-acyl-sn-glycerol-3-phosphate acyltransferase [Acidimicrobiia bacterium]
MATPKRDVGPLARATHDHGGIVVGRVGRLLTDLEITGSVPPGPAVLAANHFSFLDPLFVGVAVDRFTRYLALDELFGRSRFFDWLTLSLGTIPMSRERAPLGAMRESLRTLEQGGLVCLFPEGRRVREWGENAPKKGAAWLALRAGVPLIPIAISGTEIVWPVDASRPRRGPVRVWVGEGWDPDSYLDHVDPATAMMNEWFEWMNGHLGQVDRDGTPARA